MDIGLAWVANAGTGALLNQGFPARLLGNRLMTPTARPKRRATTRLRTVVPAAGLVALVVVAMACGPYAPVGQDRAPANEELTATPTFTATSTATPAPDANAAPMDDILKAWVAHHNTNRGVTGQGQAAPEKTISVQIFVASPSQRGGITDFLESNGIAHSPVPGNHDIDAAVPVSLVPRLAVFPGVQELMALPHPYPSLGTYLNKLVANYEAGLMPDEDANPTFARLVIAIEGGDNYDAIKLWLENNGAVMTFADRDITELYKPSGDLVAFVPVAKIAPLAGMNGVVEVWDEGYPISEAQRFTRPSIFEKPPETPSSSTKPSDRVAGAAASVPPWPPPFPSVPLPMVLIIGTRPASKDKASKSASSSRV